MAVGFRNNSVPRNNTIDWSYLDVPIPDYKSVSEVGNTNTSGMIHQGGNSDPSGNAGSPGVNRYSGIPRLTFAKPTDPLRNDERHPGTGGSRLSTPQIPANLDFGNTIYDVDSGNFVPHEYPKIPSILGTEAVGNTLLYGRPSGAGHLSPTQVSNIHNAAAKSQAYNAAARDALWDSGASTQHYTHTDKDGNRFLIDPVEELASINQHGWDLKGNYVPDMSNAYWEHKAAQDAIANYGAHESTNSRVNNPIQDSSWLRDAPGMQVITQGPNFRDDGLGGTDAISAWETASGGSDSGPSWGESPGHPGVSDNQGGGKG